ncbi:hypothetical protein HDU76_001469, partial [Blyttiomyces sp. JEL0837]
MDILNWGKPAKSTTPQTPIFFGSSTSASTTGPQSAPPISNSDGYDHPVANYDNIAPRSPLPNSFASAFAFPPLQTSLLGGGSAAPATGGPGHLSARSIIRIRVATSAGTLLVPIAEDATVARLLAEAHARLCRQDQEDEESERSVFTAARSANGDYIQVSDLVRDVLSNGEMLLGLTEEESHYMPKDIHPLFAKINLIASQDPNRKIKQKHRPAEEVFDLSEDSDPVPPQPTQQENEDEEDEDTLGDVLTLPKHRKAGPGRRLSNAVTSPSSAAAAAIAAAAAAAAAPTVLVVPAGKPAESVESAKATNILEVLARVSVGEFVGEVTSSSDPELLVLSWVPCVVEVVGEGDDEGFMQVRFMGGDDNRVEVVGLERLRAVAVSESTSDNKADVSVGEDVEVKIVNAADDEVSAWYPASALEVLEDGAKVKVALMSGGSDAVEVTVDAKDVRRSTDAGFTPRGKPFDAVVSSLMDDDEYEEEELEE